VRKPIAGAILGGLLFTVAPPSFAAPPLGITSDGDAMVVTGLEPGAEIVYFSVSRFSAAYVPRTERRSERLADEDADGEVRIALDRPVPPKFLAVAVELLSGRFGVWTPDGSPGREVAFPENSLRPGPDQRLDRLEDGNDYVELLLVRPDRGAWALTTGDGTPSDESPSGDGLVLAALASMVPVGDSGEPPEEYEKDDLLLRVAPAEMEYYLARIVR